MRCCLYPIGGHHQYRSWGVEGSPYRAYEVSRLYVGISRAPECKRPQTPIVVLVLKGLSTAIRAQILCVDKDSMRVRSGDGYATVVATIGGAAAEVACGCDGRAGRPPRKVFTHTGALVVNTLICNGRDPASIN